MPKKISHYRVFLATPGGLDKERGAFRHLVQDYNEIEGKHRNVQFDSVGWEDIPGGSGRPQSLINEELVECDFFVLVLWDRWGSSTSAPGEPGFSSGCEEEFRLAVECYENSPRPMRDVVILFKGADYRHLADPGPQLQKVLDFKREIELNKRHYYRTFDDIASFQRNLRSLLTRWLLGHEGGIRSVAEPRVIPLVTRRSGSPEGDPELESAERLANKGRLVEAERLFARAVIRSQNKLDALNRYGRFLRQVGRLQLAEEIYHQLVELAAPDEPEWRAWGYGNLGRVYSTLGELDRAEDMHRRALEIDESLDHQVGNAYHYSNLGLIYRTRGDLVEAERMERKALEINEQVGYQVGIAKACNNLGVIYQLRDNLDDAEKMHRRALAIDEQLDRRVGIACDYGNIGLLLQAQGRLSEAEAMYRRALAIDEELGYREDMANQLSNLGSVYRVRGDLEKAEIMYRRALGINEELGRLEGMAVQYGNLGRIYRSSNDLDKAEAMHRKALEINEQLERRRGIAIQYGDLGEICKRREDLDTAREYWAKSQALWRLMGVDHMVVRIQKCLDGSR